ncbi:MAG: hypothetical protein ACJLS3_13200 [Erythrobacter sp.]
MPDTGARRRSLLLGAGIGLLGAVILALSASTILVFVMTVASGGAVIFWDEGRWMGLPIALAVLAVALALYVGRNHGPEADGPHSDTIKRLLIASFCLLVSTLVFPSSVHWLAGQHLEARGYTPCGRSFWIAPDRMPDRAAALARCEEWRHG